VKKPTIYLANPYGFSAQEKALLLQPIKGALEAAGWEVWEPFERNNQVDFSQPGWAYNVARADVSDVVKADAFFGVVNGCPPDEGVCVELGIAIALEKPIFLFRDDFRRCTDSEDYPLNLMLFAGLPRDNWREWFFTSLDELTARPNALAEVAQVIAEEGEECPREDCCQNIPCSRRQQRADGSFW
jgi:nucleoside 2-deoxyribosyltransferase